MVTKKEILLYMAFMLTTLGDRMWMFVIGLFLNKVGGITWVAAAQLLDSGSKLLMLSFCGPYFDRMRRDRLIQGSLILNNIAVAVSAGCFYLIFATSDEHPPFLYVCVAVVFASISRVASEVQRICFTKDWVVVISRADQVKLESVNSRLMIIDQSSSLILPILTGKLLDHLPWTFVCAIIIVYNIISWVFEGIILARLYRTTDALKTKSEDKHDDELNGVRGACGSCSLYFSQSSSLAGFGLAMLYMTVLGFDNIAASYGQRNGMSSELIGYFRSFGSLLGLAGAAVYPFFANRVGLLWTVMIGLLLQNIFINFSGVAVTLPGSSMDLTGFIANTTPSQWFSDVLVNLKAPVTQDFVTVPYNEVTFPVILFFIGITFARFGLWLADPAITQIQQETVPEQSRYGVFTVQTLFCEVFSILKDVVVIALPYTSLFGVLTLGSCVFVFAGFVLNITYHVKCGLSCSDKQKHIPQYVPTETEIHELQSPLVEKTAESTTANGRLEE